MSPGYFAAYLGLGITLVILGVWRFSTHRTVSGLRHVGLLLGIVILGILAASQLGLVSLDGIGECLKQNSGHRSRMIVCLFYVERRSP